MVFPFLLRNGTRRETILHLIVPHDILAGVSLSRGLGKAMEERAGGAGFDIFAP